MFSDAPVNIIILVDGLGWTLVEQTGFLASRLPFRAPVQPVTGYSSAAIPALLTGQPPNKTGKWMLFRRVRSGAGNLQWFSPMAALARQNANADQWLRKLVTWWCVRVKGWPPHFSCYNIPFEHFKKFQFEDVDMGWAPRHVGGYSTLFHKIEQNGQVLHLYGFPKPDKGLLQAASREMRAGQRGVYILYLWQLDSTFHTSFHDPARIKDVLVQYEADIEYLYQSALRQFGAVNLAIISDHGMAPVTGSVDAMAIVDQDARYRSARPTIFYNSTFLQVWCDDRSSLPVVRGALAEIPHACVLDEETLLRDNLFFSDHRFGDLFVQLEEGWVFSPNYFGREIPAGMHGYDPALPNSWAVWLSNVDIGRPNSLYQVHDSMIRLVCGSARNENITGSEGI